MFCYKYIGKFIGKNINDKYNQNLLDHAKATGDLTGNKIADKITKFSKTSSQNSLKTVESETENIEFGTYLKKDIYLQKNDRKLLMI